MGCKHNWENNNGEYYCDNFCGINILDYVKSLELKIAIALDTLELEAQNSSLIKSVIAILKWQKED